MKTLNLNEYSGGVRGGFMSPYGECYDYGPCIFVLDRIELIDYNKPVMPRTIYTDFDGSTRWERQIPPFNLYRVHLIGGYNFYVTASDLDRILKNI